MKSKVLGKKPTRRQNAIRSPSRLGHPFSFAGEKMKENSRNAFYLTSLLQS